MRIVSLASGSGGNAYLVECAGSALLIDHGLSCRELAARAETAGCDLAALAGVLFTHEHRDHAACLSTFLKRRPGVPLFANALTAEAIAAFCKVPPDAFAVFENGQPFEVGPFEVTAFPIPHDVCDPVGFLVRAEGRTYFHATDVGAPLNAVGARLAEADAATLESNHDPQLLRMSARPEALKQRICGPRGHLANDEAADLVRRFASPRLKYLALAHLSDECNAPHLAEGAMRRALEATGRTDIELEVLSQDAPSKGFWF